MKNIDCRQRLMMLLLFFAFVLPVHEAYSAQAIKIEIPEVIYTAKTTLKLGEIARITGGNSGTRRILSGLEVYPDGNILTRDEVLGAIGESDASDARIELYMPSSSRIETPGYEGNFTETETSSASNARPASELAGVIKSLSSWNGNVEVSAPGPIPEGRLIDPPSITPGVSGVTLRFEDSRGRVTPLNVRLTWTQNVMTASHNIKKGDRITERDIFPRQMKITRPGVYASSPAEIIGFTSNRNIKQGEPIQLSGLTSSSVVRKGRQVKIIARYGGASAAADGVLLEDGRPGDWVKVRRADDRRITLRARIINENTVEVRVE
ncbi:MAG: flagellar basal body P-ring formation protein FlgA [Synergistaceae bacterium]|nr:flagellar basal body P-ring formation protein FlgA [Synergistaceae bacterium]